MKREQGKYKWLVLMVTFLSQAFTYGITYSVGVLYKDWTSYFDSSASFLSLVGSAPTAVSCLCGTIMPMKCIKLFDFVALFNCRDLWRQKLLRFITFLFHFSTSFNYRKLIKSGSLTSLFQVFGLIQLIT